MYAQVEKPKENKSRAVANSVTQKKGNVKQGFGFVDNRPEVVVQRKLQEMAKKNSQVTQLKGIQQKADDRSQVKAIQKYIIQSQPSRNITPSQSVVQFMWPFTGPYSIGALISYFYPGDQAANHESSESEFSSEEEVGIDQQVEPQLQESVKETEQEEFKETEQEEFKETEQEEFNETEIEEKKETKENVEEDLKVHTVGALQKLEKAIYLNYQLIDNPDKLLRDIKVTIAQTWKKSRAPEEYQKVIEKCYGKIDEILKLGQKKEEPTETSELSSLDFDGMRQFLRDMDENFSAQQLSQYGGNAHTWCFNRHDDLLHSGQHHGVRHVRLRQLYNDIRDKLLENDESLN